MTDRTINNDVTMRDESARGNNDRLRPGVSKQTTAALAKVLALVGALGAAFGLGRSTARTDAPAGSEVPSEPRTDASAGREVPSARRAGNTKTVTLPGGATMVLRWCPPGTFTMGSPATEPGREDDEVPHKVTLSRGFWMGETEVTQRQWRELMGTTVLEQGREALASDAKVWKDKTFREFFELSADADLQVLGFCGDVNDDVPVYFVSWDEAAEFCRRLTARERDAGRLPAGCEYRLPTEAEWEYACRAGSATALPNGLDLEIKGECNAPAVGEIAWYSGNSSVGYTGRYGLDTSGWKEKEYPGGKAHARTVRGKTPNAWGVYDMIGNVSEWCADWYGDYSTGQVTDPTGPASGSNRVLRGGSWGHFARFCRSADRSNFNPSFRINYFGFRLCCSAGSSDE